jgi:hypothetical protein
MAEYSWVYWASTAGAFVFLIIDVFNDGAIWNILCVACIAVAVVTRPGGVWRRRPAA